MNSNLIFSGFLLLIYCGYVGVYEIGLLGETMLDKGSDEFWLLIKLKEK